jgi:hypothetical protein
MADPHRPSRKAAAQIRRFLRQLLTDCRNDPLPGQERFIESIERTLADLPVATSSREPTARDRINNSVTSDNDQQGPQADQMDEMKQPPSSGRSER